MDDKLIKDFLWSRKVVLLTSERIAKGKAKLAISMQLQVIDTFFQFIGSQQQETDMDKLKLSLDAQATPIDDIKPRQRENRVRESILEFIKTIPPGMKKEINDPNVSKRTVTTTLYDMKKKGHLPDEIMIITRNNQKEVYVARAKESEKEVPNQKLKGK